MRLKSEVELIKHNIEITQDDLLMEDLEAINSFLEEKLQSEKKIRCLDLTRTTISSSQHFSDLINILHHFESIKFGVDYIVATNSQLERLIPMPYTYGNVPYIALELNLWYESIADNDLAAISSEI